MFRFLPVSFLLFLSLVAHAEPCDGISLERARFAAEIRDREPMGTPSADMDALWFFTEVHGASGRTLHHLWFWRGERIADVTLEIGGDRWRTWSSKVVGQRSVDDWQVEVRLDDGCLLGRYSLTGTVPDRPPTGRATEAERQPATPGSPTESEKGQGTDDKQGTGDSNTGAEIRALLKAGDVTGARLALAKAGPLQANERERLELEIALARIDAQVANDELYLANARLEHFLSQTLPPALQQEASELKEKLEKRRRSIDDQMTVVLNIWEKSRQEATGGLVCADSQQALESALASVKGSEHLMINPPRREDDEVVAEVLDRRTGLMHRVSQYCPRWQGE